MPRGDSKNWGGARPSTRPNAKKRGPKPSTVTAEIGKDAMRTLTMFATLRQMTTEALAARWLGERIEAEWAEYDAEIQRDAEKEGELL